MDVSRLVCAVCIAATILVDRVRSRASCRLTLPRPAGSNCACKRPPAPPAQAPPHAHAARAGHQPTQQERNRQLKNQQLIDNAEQAYRAGVNNYHAGHLEAAKASFDYAVDQMLSSGLDLKNDPQLSAEFEHLVDAINTLEMEALKQGNGFEPRRRADAGRCRQRRHLPRRSARSKPRPRPN